MYKTIELLLVEDSASDIQLAQQFFKEYKIANPLSVVNCEMEALRFLRRQDEYTLATRPDLILISIAVFRRNHNGLLQHLRDDEGLRQIPIVVLTTSQEDEDNLADHLHVNLCIRKPLNLDCLGSMVKAFGDFGFSMGVDRDESAFA